MRRKFATSNFWAYNFSCFSGIFNASRLFCFTCDEFFEVVQKMDQYIHERLGLSQLVQYIIQYILESYCTPQKVLLKISKNSLTIFNTVAIFKDDETDRREEKISKYISITILAYVLYIRFWS